MAVNLGIIGGLVAGKVSPQENRGNQQQDDGKNQEHPEARIMPASQVRMETCIGRRHRRGRRRRKLFFRGGSRRCSHSYLPFRYCFTPCSALPSARASSTLSSLSSYTLE